MRLGIDMQNIFQAPAPDITNCYNSLCAFRLQPLALKLGIISATLSDQYIEQSTLSYWHASGLFLINAYFQSVKEAAMESHSYRSAVVS